MSARRQTTDTVLMIRPSHFRCNEQTAVNNYFQIKSETTEKDATDAAQAEFDHFVSRLKEKGIRVITVQDDTLEDTPDSVFPNNWISFHQNSSEKKIGINIYPMFAENRRLEKNLRRRISNAIEEELGSQLVVMHDYSVYEKEETYLEGTGSLILDRSNSIAYCAVSPRAHPEMLDRFCQDMGFSKIAFTAYQTVDKERLPIYHTNVMMCIGDKFATICLECIDDVAERKRVTDSLLSSGKEIIELSEQQIKHFAGNMLLLESRDLQQSVVAMSSEAFNSLTQIQKEKIEAYASILHVPLHMIEQNGGGSARCMMAEVFC